MQIGNRFRCYPTPTQKKILMQWIGHQRSIYNAKVREDQYFRRFAQKSLQHTGKFAPIDQQYARYKTELTPWLSDVPSQILRNGATKWKNAYGRYFSKLGGRPVIHKKQGKQSVWITKELFRFTPIIDKKTDQPNGQATLQIGTTKHPLGILNFKAHKEYRLPASIHISVHANQWYVSFNYDDGVPEPSDADIIAWLKQHSAEELLAMTFGGDRGVNIPLAGNRDSQDFDFKPIEKKRLSKQERYAMKWQRKQSRRIKGSNRHRKAGQRVAKHQRYVRNLRNDFAHQTSHTLTSNPKYKLFVFEALNVKKMTKRAKPKRDSQGNWIKNGAAAKSGLNKAILGSVWGKVKTYTKYKSRRKGKFSIDMPANYSSQECAACGHVHPDNRKKSEFVCLCCGNREHADRNAAKVIAKRGVALLLSEGFTVKEKKRVGIKRNKVSAGCAELGGVL